MKAIRFDQFGEPEQVLRVQEVPDPIPGKNEVLVRMIASPINPSDLLVVRGRYGVLPDSARDPRVRGGRGRRGRSGPRRFRGSYLKGKRVAVLNGAGGNWAEKVVVPALRAIPVRVGPPRRAGRLILR